MYAAGAGRIKPIMDINNSIMLFWCQEYHGFVLFVNEVHAQQALRGSGMETTIFITGVAAVVIFGAVYHHIAKKKQIFQYLASRYGKKPDKRECDFHKIRILWEELDDRDKGIDEITWDDLGMDDVFSRINACSSSLGEQFLYRCIRRSPQDYILCQEGSRSEKKYGAGCPKEDAELEFLERQIRFFAENSQDRYAAQKLLFRFGKRSSNYSIPMFLNNLDIFRLNGTWIYMCLFLLLIVSIVTALYFRTAPAYSFLGVSFLVNLCIYALMKSKYEIHLDSIAGITCIMGMCLEFSDAGESGVYNSLKPFRKTAKKIRKSAVFMNERHQRTYTADFVEMCAMYITGAFLLDFIFFNKIVGLLEKNRAQIMEIILAAGQIDMAVSIASYRESLPFYCVPDITEEPVIDYRNIYHPLLDHPVCNDFRLESNCIITGSNASGKSTFIKAIAINEILALSIHTCTADRAVMPKMETCTSMAVKDDLLAGESYFVKEIKSLNRIIRSVEGGKRTLIVIDEILRGTNTKERVAASAAILKYLKKKNCMAVTASHDLELTRLLKDQGYRNYYFCEKKTEGLIEFDYKIHEGVCMQTNAIELLEYYGFPKNIVREAKNIAGEALIRSSLP